MSLTCIIASYDATSAHHEAVLSTDRSVKNNVIARLKSYPSLISSYPLISIMNWLEDPLQFRSPHSMGMCSLSSIISPTSSIQP